MTADVAQGSGEGIIDLTLDNEDQEGDTSWGGRPGKDPFTSNIIDLTADEPILELSDDSDVEVM
jgi:hypothetical protein